MSGVFVLAGAARVAMAVIFAQAAWQALRDVGAHAGHVAGYRLLPEWAVWGVAWGLPLLSAVAAGLLVAPGFGRAGAVLGLGLMGLFTGAIAANVWRGRVHIDCGCGGARGQRISWALVERNAVLMAMLALAAGVSAQGPVGAAALVGMAGGGAAAAMLYFAAGQLLANRAAFGAAGFGG